MAPLPSSCLEQGRHEPEPAGNANKPIGPMFLVIPLRNTSGRVKMMVMDAEQRTRAALDALGGLKMKPELAAYRKAGADLAEQHKAQREAAEAAILQKRRAALAKRTAAMKEKLRAEQ